MWNKKTEVWESGVRSQQTALNALQHKATKARANDWSKKINKKIAIGNLATTLCHFGSRQKTSLMSANFSKAGACLSMPCSSAIDHTYIYVCVLHAWGLLCTCIQLVFWYLCKVVLTLCRPLWHLWSPRSHHTLFPTLHWHRLPLCLQ